MGPAHRSSLSRPRSDATPDGAACMQSRRSARRSTRNLSPAAPQPFHIMYDSNMYAEDANVTGMQPTLWLVADGGEQVGVGGQGRLADALCGAQDGL